MLASKLGLVANSQRITKALSANQTNYNLFTALGSPAGVRHVTLVINSGVVISSSSPSNPALDTGSGWAVGSTLKIINNGSIRGAGGAGGNSNATFADGDGTPSYSGSLNGGAGGDALKLTLTTTIDNSSGEIFGGGGGGGASASGVVEDEEDGNSLYGARGSGGGGGRGHNGGSAGSAGTLSYSITPTSVNVSSSADGGVGSSSSAGSGGAGSEVLFIAGVYIGSEAGGAGGDWGSSGSSGGRGYSRVGASYYDPETWLPPARSGGSGGAAGKAVNVNGQSLTWLGGNDGPSGTHVKGSVT